MEREEKRGMEGKRVREREEGLPAVLLLLLSVGVPGALDSVILVQDSGGQDSNGSAFR